MQTCLREVGTATRNTGVSPKTRASYQPGAEAKGTGVPLLEPKLKSSHTASPWGPGSLCLPLLPLGETSPECHRQAPAVVQRVTLLLTPTEPVLPFLRKSLEPSFPDPASSLQSHVQPPWGF